MATASKRPLRKIVVESSFDSVVDALALFDQLVRDSLVASLDDSSVDSPVELLVASHVDWS